MAYGGVHGTNYPNNYNDSNSNNINKNWTGGYDLQIFLEPKNAEDYICVMYILYIYLCICIYFANVIIIMHIITQQMSMCVQQTNRNWL